MCTIGVTFTKNNGFILFKNRDLSKKRESGSYNSKWGNGQIYQIWSVPE